MLPGSARPEQRGGVVGVVEGVGGGLVDRQCAAGREYRGRGLPGVICLVSERPVVGGHGVLLLKVTGRDRRPRRRGGTGERGGVSDSDTCEGSASGFPSPLGPVMADPRLPCSRGLLNLVNHPGHPTAVEGCRAASRAKAGTHDREPALPHIPRRFASGSGRAGFDVAQYVR